MDKNKLLKEMKSMDQGDIIDIHYDKSTFHVTCRGIEYDVDGRRISEASDVLDFIMKECPN